MTDQWKRKGAFKSNSWQDKRVKAKQWRDDKKRRRGDGGDGDDNQWRRDFEGVHAGSYAAEELAALDARNAERAAAGLGPEPEIEPGPKKKVAVVLGYCGHGYRGMQVNTVAVESTSTSNEH